MSMSKVESSLTRLEAHLRELIEGDPAVDGIGQKFHKQLVRGLIEAMRSGVIKHTIEQASDQEKPAAPDLYTIILPPSQAQQLLNHPLELDRLCQKLELSAARFGFAFQTEPMIRVVADPHANRINVIAEFNKGEVADTSTAIMQGFPGEAELEKAMTGPRSFLIINGLATYPLNMPVVNIGRDSSNEVRLDDLRISRWHAQLRFIQGKYVIFDLDSKGGTYVNDVAVTSHVLNPGDVILLAGVPLVYGQEALQQSGFTQELPVDPPTPQVL